MFLCNNFARYIEQKGNNMANKENFFGVSDADVAKRREQEALLAEIAEKKRKEQEVAEEKAKEETRLRKAKAEHEAYLARKRKEAYDKYLKPHKNLFGYWSTGRKMFCGAIFSIMVMLGFVEISNQVAHSERFTLKKTYNPTTAKDAKDICWSAFNYIALSMLLFGILYRPEDYVRVVKDNKQRKTDAKAVDAMVDIGAYFNCKNPVYSKHTSPVVLDKKTAELMASTAKTVVSHMSADDRIFFDALMNKKIKIEDNKVLTALAVNIMTGHLQSNPKDAELVVNTFNWDSMPYQMQDALMTVYNKNKHMFNTDGVLHRVAAERGQH